MNKATDILKMDVDGSCYTICGEIFTFCRKCTKKPPERSAQRV